MRRQVRFIGLAAMVVASTSCGNVVRDGRSPAILTMTSLTGASGHGGTPAANLLSDVITEVTSPDPCSAATPCPTVFNDVGTAAFSAAMKNTSISPTSNNLIVLDRYHVEYARTDGRNTPGVDVPYPFDGAVTLSLSPGQTASTGFELVRITAKEEPPLASLAKSGFISAIATVTFYGHDLVGNDMSASGKISINFGNFADQ